MACMAVCTWNTTLKGNTFKSTLLGSLLKHWGPQAPCVSPFCKPLVKYLFLGITRSTYTVLAGHLLHMVVRTVLQSKLTSAIVFLKLMALFMLYTDALWD